MNYTDDQLKQRDAVSNTPRTSAATKTYIWSGVKHVFVDAIVAEQLERELAAVTAERDRLRDTKWEGITKLESDLAASQQEARRLREALDAIMESAKVAYCATTDPMMTDALVGIGKRCKDAIEND